jgi:NADH pyrophosphatase NudC (nudix superfamily)
MTDVVLAIGCLVHCYSCDRNKREPGARWCPDCTPIETMVGEDWDALEYLEEMWQDHKNGVTPKVSRKMSQHSAYRAFRDVDDLMEAYSRWRSVNESEIRHRRARFCPYCGQEMED